MTVSDNRPRSRKSLAMYLMVGYTALQVIRVFAAPIIADASDGVVSEAWLVPAMMDVLIGVAAPFIAFVLLRRRGLAVWTSAIAFFAVSIADHLGAITTLTLGSGPDPSMFSNTAASVGQLVAFSAIELAIIVALATRYRAVYLGSADIATVPAGS